MIFPLAFTNSIRNLLGPTESEALLLAIQGESPISIRYNPLKNKQELSKASIPWASNACYLPARPSFTLDPLFHAGSYYVQEASSMLIEQAITQHLSKSQDRIVLDLCAAPGGKSTHLASLLSKSDILVSNEVNKLRGSILSENIQKWGSGNVLVSRNDSSDFKKLPEFFDCILIDAPCSGEGMFRKDPKSIAEWSLSNVQTCVKRQQLIFDNIWASLKPGGILIYSTCTYNTAENEEQVDYLLENYAASALSLTLDPSWGVSPGFSKNPCYRMFPHKLRGEGFFCAVLQKEGIASKRQKSASPLKNIDALLSDAIKNGIAYDRPAFFDIRGELYACDESHLPKLQQLNQALYLLYAFTGIGVLKGKDLIPAPALALSSLLKATVFEQFNCSTDEILAILSGETPTIAVQKTAWLQCCYQNQSLAFLKTMPNRSNNYYPKEWRIRMDFRAQQLKEQGDL